MISENAKCCIMNHTILLLQDLQWFSIAFRNNITPVWSCKTWYHLAPAFLFHFPCGFLCSCLWPLSFWKLLSFFLLQDLHVCIVPGSWKVFPTIIWLANYYSWLKSQLTCPVFRENFLDPHKNKFLLLSLSRDTLSFPQYHLAQYMIIHLYVICLIY